MVVCGQNVRKPGRLPKRFGWHADSHPEMSRGGKLALCVLAVYPLLALPYDLLQFSQTDFGGAENKTLLVHMVWRVLALFYMGRLYYRMGKPAAKDAKRS